MGRNKKVRTSELLEVFITRNDLFEPLTAAEVADEVGLSRRSTANRLRELADTSPPALKTKKSGAKSRVWWPNADVWYPDLPQLELRNIAVEDVQERLRGRDLDAPVEADIEPLLKRTLRDIDIPGEGELLLARRDAVRDIFSHLAKEGKASRQELCELVNADEVGYESVDSFWTNMIIRKRIMKELPGVVPPGEGGHYYRYLPG